MGASKGLNLPFAVESFCFCFLVEGKARRDEKDKRNDQCDCRDRSQQKNGESSIGHD